MERDLREASSHISDLQLEEETCERDELLAVARFAARSEAKRPDADMARLIATGVLNHARLKTLTAEMETLHRGEREAAEAVL